MAEFASRGVANTGLGLGIAGTALGLLDGLMNKSTNSEDRAVSRYELSLVQENAILKAQADVDKKLVEVYNAMNDKANSIRDSFNTFEKEQLVYNGVNTATLSCMQQQISNLLSMTKTVIPNTSVSPGWGNATVTVSTGTTTTT